MRAGDVGMRVAAWLVALAASVPVVMTPAAAQSLDWQTVAGHDRAALASALVVGREEQLDLYACRALAGSGVQPGRFRADFAGCHIGFGGQEMSVAPFEVLSAAWQEDEAGGVPTDSLAAGMRAVRGGGAFGLATLHPCRAAYQGGVQVGEVAAGDRGCSFGYGGRQVTEQHYQVLWQAPWMAWVPGIPHQIPAWAVPAGSEGGEAFYVCRAADQNGLHPGKVRQSAPGCSIASDGRELVATQFALLVPRWIEGRSGTIPVTALPAGHERAELLYVCRTQMRGAVQVGRIGEQLASCHVGMMGGEIAGQAYEILSVK